jgi:hypothetical protein
MNHTEMHYQFSTQFNAFNLQELYNLESSADPDNIFSGKFEEKNILIEST